MSALQSATQAVTNTVLDLASGVVDTANVAVSDTVKQVAKTPLDILEELLGSSGGDQSKNIAKEESGGGGQMAQAALKQQQEKDESFKVTQHTQLHDQIMQQSQGYYEQKKQMDAQQRIADEQQQEQKKYEVRQLEKRKSENYALKAAQATKAETNASVGAG